MNLKTDLISRLKAAKHSSGSGVDSKTVSMEWFLMLLLGFLLIVATGVYSFYRFSYWVSIDERVASTEVTAAQYDEEAIHDILVEFSEKDLVTKELLNGVDLESIQLNTEEVATTTLEVGDGE